MNGTINEKDIEMVFSLGNEQEKKIQIDMKEMDQIYVMEKINLGSF